MTTTFIRISLLLVLLISTLTCFPQDKKVPAKIIFDNGDSLQGFLQMPYIADYEFVELYAAENSKTPQKIDMHDIRIMTLRSDVDTVDLICAKAKFKKRPADKDIWRRTVFKKSNLWLFVSFGGVFLDSTDHFGSSFTRIRLKLGTGYDYLTVATYSIVKKEVIFSSEKLNTQYMLRVGGDGTPFLGSNSAIRKTSRFYFKDCPMLVERINKKEFKATEEDIKKMMTIYVESCK